MPEQKDRFTRRGVIKLAATAGAALLGVASARAVDKGLPSIPTLPHIEFPHIGLTKETSSEVSGYEEKLKNLGLGDFMPLFQASRRMEEKYGTTLFERDIAGYLNKIAGGNFSSTDKEVIDLRDGWQIRQSSASSYVTERIRRLSIDVSEVPDSEDDLRDLFTQIGNTFPAMVICAPDKIKILPGGGGFTNGVTLGVGSIKKNGKEGPVVGLLHELTHCIEGGNNWLKMKNYVSREKTISYYKAYFDHVTSVFDTWFSLPWKEAAEFKHKQPLLTIFGLNDQNVVKMYSDLEEQYKDDLESTLPPDKVNDWGYRANRVIHFIGGRMRTLLDKKNNGQTLTKEETSFIYNSTYQKLMQDSANEVAHFFVGPMQKSPGMLPDTVSDLEDIETQLVASDWAIQQSRFAMLSDKTVKLEDLRANMGLELHNLNLADATPKQKNEIERKKQLEANKQLLLKYNCKVVGEYKFQDKEATIYQLPGNPLKQEIRHFFMDMPGPDSYINNGILFSIPLKRPSAQFQRADEQNSGENITDLFKFNLPTGESVAIRLKKDPGRARPSPIDYFANFSDDPTRYPISLVGNKIKEGFPITQEKVTSGAVYYGDMNLKSKADKEVLVRVDDDGKLHWYKIQRGVFPTTYIGKLLIFPRYNGDMEPVIAQDAEKGHSAFLIDGSIKDPIISLLTKGGDIKFNLTPAQQEQIHQLSVFDVRPTIIHSARQNERYLVYEVIAAENGDGKDEYSSMLLDDYSWKA